MSQIPTLPVKGNVLPPPPPNRLKVLLNPRGTQQSYFTRRLRHEVQPLTPFITIFNRKGTPSLYLLLTNGTSTGAHT